MYIYEVKVDPLRKSLFHKSRQDAHLMPNEQKLDPIELITRLAIFSLLNPLKLSQKSFLPFKLARVDEIEIINKNDELLLDAFNKAKLNLICFLPEMWNRVKCFHPKALDQKITPKENGSKRDQI